MKPKDVITLNNKDLILECVVTGYPTPHATWRKDGQKLTLVPDGHYAPYGANNLKITSVQPADGGKYECVIGLRKAEANVQVIGMLRVWVTSEYFYGKHKTTAIEDIFIFNILTICIIIRHAESVK